MILDRPDQNKLIGLYRGKVLQHLPDGKLKVYIPGVYPPEFEMQPGMLPDAEISVPLFGGNNMGNGVFSYPNINSIVLCEFFNGDQNYPVVVGATQGASLAQTRYSEVANELEQDGSGSPACIHMFNVGKTKIKMYEGGQVEIQVAGADAKSAVILDKNGNIFLCCDKTLQMQAENIKIMAKNQLDVVANDITQTSGKQMVIQGGSVTAIASAGRVQLQSAVNPAGKMI